MSRSWISRSTSKSDKLASSHRLKLLLEAIRLTMLPPSAFFFKTVPAIGARMVVFASRYSALISSAWASSALAAPIRSARGPSCMSLSASRSRSMRSSWSRQLLRDAHRSEEAEGGGGHRLVVDDGRHEGRLFEELGPLGCWALNGRWPIAGPPR